MSFWLAMAVLTAAVLGALLVPLLRKPADGITRKEFDLAVFRDQLAELDRDKGHGLIGEEEAEAARNEISRRLLAASHAQERAASGSRSRRAAVAAVAAIPLIAIPIYLRNGAPTLRDVPLKDRIEHAVENQDMVALVAKVEEHLAKNPDDAKGWTLLAPIYRHMSRFEDAARAYSNILRLSPPVAETLADYAEMLVFANQGVVSSEANKAFAEALKLDANNPKARYFAALALKQEGKAGEAIAAWKALLADSPADAAWRNVVEQEIASANAPGPTQDQVAAAQNMNPEDRQNMIRSMVDGLEQRLKENGNDLEGWQRLINARMVLGEQDKAKFALLAAEKALKDKPEALASLNEFAKNLSLQ
jgi:cytochrome c-type biogenesis protein CcmH